MKKNYRYAGVLLMVLLLAALVLGYSLAQEPGWMPPDPTRYGGALMVWRVTLYCVLLYSWPYLLRRLHPNQANAGGASRYPLLAVIVLYEGLVVANPLQAVVNQLMVAG